MVFKSLAPRSTVSRAARVDRPPSAPSTVTKQNQTFDAISMLWRSSVGRLFVGLLVVGMVFLLPARAQEFRALLAGRVVDSSGASVANAQVAVLNTTSQVR